MYTNYSIDVNSTRYHIDITTIDITTIFSTIKLSSLLFNFLGLTDDDFLGNGPSKFLPSSFLVLISRLDEQDEWGDGVRALFCRIERASISSLSLDRCITTVCEFKTLGSGKLSEPDNDPGR